MSPLVLQLLQFLSVAFGLGLVVGWLIKQYFATRATHQLSTTWEERFRQQQLELEATQHLARKNSTQAKNVRDQLAARSNELTKMNAALTIANRELEVKTSEIIALNMQLKGTEDRANQDLAELSLARQQIQQLEQQTQTLRHDLIGQTEAHRQVSQRLNNQDSLIAKLRDHDTSLQMQRSRLEFTIRSKDTELQQLRDRLATVEAQQQHLSDRNSNLQHSCAHYQSRLHEQEAEIGRLQAQVQELKSPAVLPVSPFPLLPFAEIRTFVDVRDKDNEIARLRARIAGLQLLLRRRTSNAGPIASITPIAVSHLSSQE